MRAPWLAVLATVIVLTLGIAAARAETSPRTHSIVLVQDTAADSASWANVVPLLESAGLRVTLAKPPMRSLDAAIAETRRVLTLQAGLVVLVGQGWGGAVTSEVGADPKVSALVYLEAVAPEAGEEFAALAVRFSAQPLTEASLAGTKIDAAAWRDKPTFYAVSKDDATMPAELQRFYAARMNAKTIVLDGDALPGSHPRETAGLILEAAGMRPPACGAENDDGLAACAAPALPRSLMKGCKCTKAPLEDLTAP
jgi:pimeloyl-ACP methyl ester carboxylesterase